MSPNPGSAEAHSIGCRCPVIDNNRGTFPVNGDPDNPLWVVNMECPVHGVEGQ